MNGSSFLAIELKVVGLVLDTPLLMIGALQNFAFSDHLRGEVFGGGIWCFEVGGTHQSLGLCLPRT